MGNSHATPSHHCAEFIPSTGHTMATAYFKMVLRDGREKKWTDKSAKSAELGRGSFGIVYKVCCRTARTNVEDGPRKGATYALKLSERARVGKEEWRHILREVEILKRIRSPLCVRLFDAFQDHSGVCLVLEYIDGGELLAYVKAHQFLPEDGARHIARQLMRALAYLHDELQVVHRDLKPENILVTQRGGRVHAKLIDFGLATFFGARWPRALVPDLWHARDLHDLAPGVRVPDSRLWRLGNVLGVWRLWRLVRFWGVGEELMRVEPCGTRQYCAPEVLEALRADGPLVTTRRDIQKLDTFAAGAVAYFMLTGRHAFRARDPQQLLEEVRRGPAFPDYPPVPDRARQFCCRLMGPAVRQRPLARQSVDSPWLRAPARDTEWGADGRPWQSPR